MVTRKTTARSSEKAAPAAKTAKPGRSAAPPPPPPPNASVTTPFGEVMPTDVQGIYRNKAGVLVDSNGMLLGLAAMRQHESKEAVQVIGEEIKTPAQYLKAVALDPRQPAAVRIDAAKAAAPYTDRKQPTSIDGGVDPRTGEPIALFKPEFWEGFSEYQMAIGQCLLECKGKTDAETVAALKAIPPVAKGASK